ncbi:MAG: type II toxin-antitoxin system RelE/ParE family toxin [Nanoarchaeota archaeon]|nr:type II toxin-antitoxin system RelE/ParE family toxin [Nanoarchaeota archaeon]
MYELVYAPTALKTLEKLDNTTKERILIALERLRIRPTSCDIKNLVGMGGYRFRVGNYRIIFDMDNSQLKILVLKIGHRKNVYD